MINFPYECRNGKVFIHCAQSPEGSEYLENLLRQTETICRIVGKEGKTGLRIVGSFTLNGCFIAIFSLGDMVELIKNELDLIKQEVNRKLK